MTGLAIIFLKVILGVLIVAVLYSMIEGIRIQKDTKKHSEDFQKLKREWKKFRQKTDTH